MNTNIFDEFEIDGSLGDNDKHEELEKKVLTILKENISMQEKFTYNSYREFYEILQMIDIKKLRANLAEQDMTRTIGRYDIIPMQHRVFSGMIRKLQLNNVKLATLLNESDMSSKQIDVLQKLCAILFSTKETQSSFFQTIDEALGIGNGFCVTKLKNQTQKIVSGAVTKVKGAGAKYTYNDVTIKYPYMQYVSAFDTIYTDNGKIQAYCEYVPYSVLKKQFELTPNELDEVKKSSYIQTKNWNACKDVKVFYNSLLNMISTGDESCIDSNGKVNYTHVANELEKWFSIEKEKKAEVRNLFIESELGTFEINVANGKIVGYGDSTLPFTG